MSEINVLMIGSDTSIFDENSQQRQRIKWYAEKMQTLHLVVFTMNNSNYEKIQILNNIYVYPTKSISKFFYIKDAKIASAEIIKKNKIDVVTCQDPFESGLVGLNIKEKYKIPLQLQIHTDFLSPYFKNTFLNRIRVLISNLTIPRADGLRVVSEVVRDSLLLKYNNLRARIDILPIWVDIENFNSTSIIGDIMSPYTILMVSRLSLEKNIIVAIKSFSNLIKKYPNEGLYIVGDGKEKNNIYKEVQKLNLESKVKIIGWEQYGVILSLYKKAKIFLSTSDFEGYGMTLVEAAASGCPIVTTRVGIAKTDLFKDGINSYVCEVGDVDCLSRKLEDLIINEEKRKSFVKNMNDSISKILISREDYVNKYINLLKSII